MNCPHQQSSVKNLKKMTRMCSVLGCDQTMRRRGYCTHHFDEWQKLDNAEKAAALASLAKPRTAWTYEGDEAALIAAQEKANVPGCMPE
jgi:hypothetical protein